MISSKKILLSLYGICIMTIHATCQNIPQNGAHEAASSAKEKKATGKQMDLQSHDKADLKNRPSDAMPLDSASHERKLVHSSK